MPYINGYPGFVLQPASSIRPPYWVNPSPYDLAPILPYAPQVFMPAPTPWGAGTNVMLGAMAGWGIASLLSSAMWWGFGGWGMGLPFMGMGFGSGLWSPFPTWDNWNGGFNLPGVF